MTNPITRNLLDTETGEYLSLTELPAAGSETSLPKRGRHPQANDSFVMMWPGRIVGMPLLSSRQRSIFDVLASWMDTRTGVVSFYLDEVCEAAGISAKSTASIYISRIIDAGYARRLRNRRVVLNPHLTWRGNKGDRNVAIWRWDNLATGHAMEFELIADEDDARRGA